MTDILATIFLWLAVGFTIPFNFISSLLLKNSKKNRNLFYVLVAVSFALAIGAIVNCVIGEINSGYYSYNDLDYAYRYYYRHPCVWVGMGLSIGSIFLSAITLSVILFVHFAERKNPTQTKVGFKVANSRKNYDYIDELKELKKLLDCGAITQQEYDMKKKHILDDVLK